MVDMVDFIVINIDLYNFDICLSINESDDELKKSLKNNYDKKDFKYLYNLKDTTESRFYMSSNNLSIIRLKLENEIPHGTIAHEIFHCATFILNRVGINFDLDKNDEAFAYLIGYITKKVYEIINKEQCRCDS